MRLRECVIGVMVAFAGAAPAACSSKPTGYFNAVDAGGGSGGTHTTGGSSSGGRGGGSSGGTNGFGVACNSDKDCHAYGLLCDPSLGCVDCVRAADCPAVDAGEVACTAGRCETVVPCKNSLTCPSDQVCDTALGRCVACVSDTDCSSGSTCQANRCVRSSSCVTTANCQSPQLCDQATGRCVDCLTENNCKTGQSCVLGACVDKTGSCKPEVVMLLQRSGAMFELPSTTASWWDSLETAMVAGSAPLIDQVGGQVSLGALAFYRLTETQQSCPLFQSAPTPADRTSLTQLFTSARQAWQTTTSKVDAPVPEAIGTAVTQLGVASGSNPRFIVLVSTGTPDSCTVTDGYCALDPTVAAVQAAHRAGVTTLVLGLGADSSIEYSSTTGYTAYLAALANAGMGLSVAGPPITCSAATGQYATTGGSAAFGQALTPAEIGPSLAVLFSRILASCP